MIKLVSNKGHSLEITEDSFTVTPEIEITEIVDQYRNNKLQLLSALSQLDSKLVWALVSPTGDNKPVTYGVNTLSVVSIVPDVYHEVINLIAELYGCGSENLSVKLKDDGGEIFWGCHSWWTPDNFAEFTDDESREIFLRDNTTEEFAASVKVALTHLYERVVMGGFASNNWETALSELGLSVYTEP